MFNNSIQIPLPEIEEDLFLNIKGKRNSPVFHIKDAIENGEAEYQIAEGSFYQYQFSSSNYFLKADEIIDPSSFSINEGSISPNIYVGTLSLPVFEKNKTKPVGFIKIEVQSLKSTYREDYRYMLENITEKCTDLLMQSNSPVSQNFEVDFSKDSQTIYQRFTFIKSIITSDEFNESIHRIVTSPNTSWTEKTEDVDIRKVGRLRHSHLKQISSGSNRIKFGKNHPLLKSNLKSFPSKIRSNLKTETLDTPENRFIKHALNTFLKLCTDIQSNVKKDSRLFSEVSEVISNLETHLHHSFFSEISEAQTLKLNSPILQRKEGYREILKAWLMFDLAARLIWEGGEDVYGAGKRDVATLYEYWLFFTLLDLLKDLFEISPKDLDDLIKPTKDNLGLQLVQGSHTALRGVYQNGLRPLNIKFNFNRTFKGNKTFPAGGSWTKTMRPDYTISVWPNALSEKEAEKEELIVHIHFDAKYKIDNFKAIFNQDENLDEEKKDQAKGKYKNADLLKMHAYKDAIRRTGGAYVLYPGNDPIEKRGFRELIPGLGAFPVRPSRTDNGISELRLFIEEVLIHFTNRASQRENLAYRVFDIHKEKPNEIKEPIPEAFGINRNLLPGETSILVGGYHSKDHLEWIIKKGLYNFRMESGSGSLILDLETVKSKYILLHTFDTDSTDILLKIIGKGPKVFSRDRLIELGYPKSPTQDNYLIFEVEICCEKEFQDVKWRFKNLNRFNKGRGSFKPFTTNLTELMSVVEK